MCFNSGPGSALPHHDKEQVKTMEDVRGMKLRSREASHRPDQGPGTVPIMMPMPDAYQSLDKGVIDAWI